MTTLRALFASLLLITSGLQAANIPTVALPVAQPQPTFTTKASNRIKSWWANVTGTARASHRRFANSTNSSLSFIKRHKGKFALSLGLAALGLYAYYDYRRTGRNPFYKAKASLNRFGSSVAGHWDSAYDSFNDIVSRLSNEPAPVMRNCGICMDNVDSRQFPKLNCGHDSYCKGCLSGFLDSALNGKNTGNFKCPQCAKKLEESDVRKITRQNRAKYNQFLDIVTNEYLNSLGTKKQCPTPDCNNAFINDATLDFWVARTCEGCNHTYCANCLKDHDQNIKCTRVAEIEALDPDGKHKFNEWKAKNTRPCPGCQKAIEKNAGCIHMTCSHSAGGCGHKFCWHCGAEWKNRLHTMGNVINQGDFYGCTNSHKWWK